MALVALLFMCLVLGTCSAETAMLTMLDIMADFSTGGEYDRGFLDELYGCWDSVDPTMRDVHERMWQVSIHYTLHTLIL